MCLFFFFFNSDLAYSSWTPCDMSRGQNIPPKLVLHNYKSISLHDGTCRYNISLGHVPATFSCVCKCCDFVPATSPRYTSLLHVASVCTTQVFCRCSMALRHVPATWPLVSAHLEGHRRITANERKMASFALERWNTVFEVVLPCAHWRSFFCSRRYIF